MARPIWIWLPSAIALALSACGGSSEGGFFSDVVSGAGGSNFGGVSSRAGSTAGSGGPASAGASNTGGAPVSGGSPGAAGRTEAGASSGGAPTAGTSSGGRAGSNSNGGSGGGAVATGGGGTAGHGGGAAAGHGGAQAGSGGSGNPPTCSELLKQASEQLDAARVCNFAANAQQCTGTVKNQCNCEVSVHRDDSAETKAYLATLKQLSANNCISVCTAVLCKPVIEGQCKQSGSSAMGMCTAASNGAGPGP